MHTRLVRKSTPLKSGRPPEQTNQNNIRNTEVNTSSMASLTIYLSPTYWQNTERSSENAYEVQESNTDR